MLDRLGDAAMEAHALRHAELLVERLADERVREHEPERARLARVRDDALALGLLEQLEHTVARQLRHQLDYLDAELAAHRARHGQHTVAVLAQAVEAAADHLAHALRDR